MISRRRNGWLAIALAAPALLSAEGPESIALEAVTVTATRIDASAFEVPAAIDTVQLSEPALGVSLAEPLQALPGVVARERQNYAQDTQISIRGFGARAPFGIRGVRLLLDGVPATQPDGQGQVSHFHLASADRVEVLRGPFSALHGNSSGGVIQLFTAEAAARPRLALDAFASSAEEQRYSLVGSGHGGTLGYSYFHTAGQRQHSAAERHALNGKLTLGLGTGRSLTLLANHLDAPGAQDPLGLTRAQFDSDPAQTASQAQQFDTRKSTAQSQLAAIYTQAFENNRELRLLGYGGARDIEQFLAIPVAAQSSATASGGVVDLGSQYGGIDARFSAQYASLNWVAGISLDTLRQHRRGYENFVGSRTGVRGGLRRDEINTVTAFDQYLQVDWLIHARLSLLAGIRHSALRFVSHDRYVRDGNGDDSGRLRYEATTPVAGLLFRLSPQLHTYASYGTGFETPTFAELAYRPDGAAGLNLALRPARSGNAEWGLKLRPTPHSRIGLAVFRNDSRNELVTASNQGGRATFANAASTRRQGLELSLQAPLSRRVDAQLAYSWLDATVRESYLSCTGQPCAAAQTTIPRGARLPGVGKSQLFSQLRYRPSQRWQLAAEWQYSSAVPVNDRNSEAAPAYSLLDLAAAFQPSERARFSLRLDNLLDARYAGSVIVNEGNGRYYEPGRGRSLLVGVELDLSS